MPATVIYTPPPNGVSILISKIIIPHTKYLNPCDANKPLFTQSAAACSIAINANYDNDTAALIAYDKNALQIFSKAETIRCRKGDGK